ncbi:MAG: NADH-dependent [FeFe] hydrogenase, group A6 [Candidatus Gastranaerophilales bacterium]|nr:NADH-dependent [FeFe] hydrogenase, group A6 [Candidatus Gastranaerophilales bacterium]
MKDKKTLFINGKEVEFTDEINLLEVMRKNGFNVPTFCYRPDLKPFGACRMCVVEIEGRGIQTSCTMPPEAGLKIQTNTERTRRIRKTVLELLLANHDRECTSCEKSGSCELQKYAEEYGIRNIRYAKKKEFAEIDDSNPSIVRDPNKCILCGACVRACEEFQGHAVLGFANRGSKTVVQPMAGKCLSDVDCVYCGQCQAVCPTGALTIKSDIENVWSEITNKDKKVVAQIAPAVRVALGEMFNLEPGENTIGKINTALREIGFDLVFDTNFSADLTIMEEGTEFLERLKSGKNLPLFTSCCPAWIRYMENTHPDMLQHLSTCKSPQSMLSPVLKEVLPNRLEGYTRENITVVSIMPCTAKKSESKREELSKDGIQDTDYTLTTSELGRMIREAGIDFSKLEPSKGDTPFGEYTGAGTIFGASGGVAEAAVRTAYEIATGKSLESIDIKELRGVHNRCRDVEFDINGAKVVVRVVSTLKEAEKSIQEIKTGNAKFHMLEVMACPGGCVNGGGQPRSCDSSLIKEKRAEGLYSEDKELSLRKSHENPEIQKLYNEFLEKPGSHKAHELLHTTYKNRLKGSYKDFSK